MGSEGQLRLDVLWARHQIDRLESFDDRACDLIEDEAVNPDWETLLAQLHPEPGASDAR